MSSFKEKYTQLWIDLRAAIEKHGRSSKEADAVREKMNQTWKAASGDDQKRFYKEWEK